MSNRCVGCNTWMDDVSYSVCAACEPNRCPNDPEEDYVHPKGTGPDDCVRCLRVAKAKLVGALKPIALVYPSDCMCRVCERVDCQDTACDGFIARQALASVFLAPPQPVRRQALDNIQALREAEAPDADGWWARREDGKVRWYRVDVTDEGPCVYVAEFHEMVPVGRLTHALTKWFGPVTLPWGKGD